LFVVLHSSITKATEKIFSVGARRRLLRLTPIVAEWNDVVVVEDEEEEGEVLLRV
jgi:hypothetical protein